MSLSSRLRAAAVDRAEKHGRTFDGFVIDTTGVIDLTALTVDPSVSSARSVALPALDEPPTVDELYVGPVGQMATWRRLPRRSTTG